MNYNPKTSAQLIADIASANSAGGSHTISLQPNTIYTFTASNNNTDGPNALPNITCNLTIKGQGSVLVRDSANPFRLLYVGSAGHLTLKGVIVSNGYLSSQSGAGIHNNGLLSVIGCQFLDNTLAGASSGYGGGIYNGPYKTAVVENCLFLGNRTGGGGFAGGGAMANDGFMTVTNCYFEKNFGQSGGAVRVLTNGLSTVIDDCVFYDNSAAHGGGVYVLAGLVSQTCTITDSTFTDNGDGAGGEAVFTALGFVGVAAPTVIMRKNRIMGNKGTVAVNGHPVLPKIDAQKNWWGAANGPSSTGSGDGDGVNTYVIYTDYLTSDKSPHKGMHDCRFYKPRDGKSTPNPISLRLGEKRLQATDLSLNSPAAALAFTRAYNQSQQTDPNFDFMGLGWTHNHDVRLTLSGTSPNRTADIYLPNGGVLVLEESGAGHFVADSGSTSVLDYNTGTSEYVLTAQDKSQYTFAWNGTTSRFEMESLLWPTGETWTYSYDGSSNLTLVEDGYGRELQFTYYSGLSGGSAYKNGQLWRVGDHTASGLSGSTPGGRYVEFDYTPEKDDGVTVSSPKALLASVQDVRGSDWTYDYYGQDSGEDDADLLNAMIARLSPAVDTTGDGSTDGPITLESLDYLYDYVIEVDINSGMEADSDWSDIVGAVPTTNQRSTTQVDSGSYSRRVVASGAGQGIESQFWNLVAGRSYVITARVYPVSGAVKMQVTGTTAFNATSSGTGAWQTLSASYTPSSDKPNRHLQFIASGAAAQFYVDSISIEETNPGLGSIIQQRGIQDSNPALLENEFVFQPNGRDQTLETTAGKTIVHHFDRGIYAGAADPAGNVSWITPDPQFQPAQQQDANGNSTWLNWSADGQQLQGVTDALGHNTTFDYYADDTLAQSVDAEGRRTLYLYEDVANPRQPTTILATTGANLAVNGDMELNSSWASISGAAPSTNVQSPLQVDSGTYARRVIASAASKGIEGAAFNLLANHTYVVIARVYPVSGVVKMQVTGSGAFDDTSSGTGTWQTLVAMHTPSSAATGQKLQFITSGGAGEFYVDNVTILDTANILRWQEFAYDSLGRTIEEKVNDPATGSLQHKLTRAYYTSGNGDGLMQSVTQHDLDDPSNDASTTYTYDSAGRVVKTQNSSLFGSCQVSYTVYDAAGNIVASICNYENSGSAPTTASAAVALYNSSDPDVNRVTTHEYDALGRRVSTTTNAGASFAQTTLTVYDALNRVIRTIANYVADVSITEPYIAAHDAFDHGVDNTDNLVTDTAHNQRGLVRKQVDALGHVTLLGYDDADRLVKTVHSASDPDYNNDYSGTGSDPDLSGYTADTAPDVDSISTNIYDPAGNLVQTVDALGSISFTVYDALNRPVKTVRSAKAAATIALNVGDTGYSAANDPRSASYSASSDMDRDLIEVTEYDTLGRVARSQDTLGRWTLFGYDDLGRQVTVIRSASNPTYNYPSDPDLSAYTASSDADQDIVSRTVYDGGRVLYGEDVLQRRSWSAYDGLGRQVKSILNAIGTATDDGTSDPRSSSYTPSSDSDEDRVSVTYYNSDGRVYRSDNARGSSALYGYDEVGRRVKTIQNASDPDYDVAADPDLSAYTPGTDSDQDILSSTVYDSQGRVWKSIDQSGIETRFVYDVLGRRISTIRNYVNGVFSSAAPDEDLIETTTYDVAGRVLTTTDVRGTQTSFTYDTLGRRQTVIRAANTPLASSDYTVYDKGGRVLRTVHNWIEDPEQPLPGEKSMGGDWLFNPTPVQQGQYADRNLVLNLSYDKLGRRIQTTDPLGHANTTTYFKDGQVESITDPLGMVTHYRYDRLRRRIRVVQSYISNGEDPSLWVWDNAIGQKRWETSGGTAITFGSNSDQNIIVDVTYDKAGRVTGQRDPRGSLTTYAYDKLDRRTGLTNPLNKTWATAYEDLMGGGSRTTLSDPNGHDTERDFDRLGRPASIAYGDPTITPDVTFAYNAAGVRTLMSESDGTSIIRETHYGYDNLRRLTSVGFDDDGDTSIDQNVSYEYDAGGLRTRLTLPGSLEVIYTYDARGQLVSLTDWDSQTTRMDYDLAGRPIASQRANGLRSRYDYDASGRLKLLRHSKGFRTLAQFEYEVDGRGNRTQARETLAHPATSSDTTFAYDADTIIYVGTWTDDAVNGFKVTDGIAASLKLLFFGDEATLTVGTGPNHGLFDVYIDKTLWNTFDGYAASTGTLNIDIQLDGDGPHVLEIRNRSDKHLYSTGYTLRFKELVITDISYDLHTIAYSYDALSRLLSADYYAGDNLSAAPFREYAYAFDLAGNRLSESLTLNGGSPSVTGYTYNAANQISSSGFVYDDNGNLTDDGPNTYTWDRANRLLSMGGSSYAYDGAGNRIQQTVGVNVTQYLLDLQPGLAVVLAETTGANTNHYVHGPIGIHAQEDNSGNWMWPLQDGLGSVRGMVNDSVAVQGAHHFAPYGADFGQQGSFDMPFGFTGEQMDSNGQVYLRARYLIPTLGVFASLDPFEGIQQNTMSLNRYSYVEGSIINKVDPTGMIGELPRMWDDCASCTADSTISYCDQWPVNDHPLVQRLCKRCREGILTTGNVDSISVSGILPSGGFMTQLITTTDFSCSGYNSSEECRDRVAELLEWVWANGGELGQRAVQGFLEHLGDVQVTFDPSLSALAKAGRDGWGNGVLIIGGDWINRQPDHVFGATFVHEMEHLNWDTTYTDTTFGEVRAYLAGYLYLLEIGYTNEQIRTELFDSGHPQWYVGNHFCFEEVNNPNFPMVFSQSGMNAYRELNPNPHSDESRLPVSRAEGY